MHPLIPIHIVGGSVALIAGYLALSVRKGSPLHAQAGTCFFLSMLLMTATGSIAAFAMPERGTAMIGIITCYLVATSWRSAKRRDGTAGSFEIGAMIVAAGCAVAMLAIGLIALGEPDGKLDQLPAVVHFPFAALAALAAALDLNFILRRRLSGPQRIGRHLWRMSAALLIAAMSFFGGQQKVMPEFIQESPLLFIPTLFVIAAMTYWIFRLRLSKAFRRFISARAAAGAG